MTPDWPPRLADAAAALGALRAEFPEWFIQQSWRR